VLTALVEAEPDAMMALLLALEETTDETAAVDGLEVEATETATLLLALEVWYKRSVLCRLKLENAETIWI